MSMKTILFFLAFFLCFSTALAGPAMPEKIAAEFSQYPGSTVMHTMSSEDMVQAILNCGKTSLETVFDYYKKHIVHSGWEVTMEIKNPDVYQMMVAKKGQDGMIAIADDNGEVSVVLSISQ